MKKLISCLAIVLFSVNTATASCIGSDSFKTCTDDNGNTYDVTKYGNTTEVSGYNSRTGSRWSQESYSIGDRTYTEGKAADGRKWNSETYRIGDNVYTDGTDSDGNRFSSVCNKHGCY